MNCFEKLKKLDFITDTPSLKYKGGKKLNTFKGFLATITNSILILFVIIYLFLQILRKSKFKIIHNTKNNQFNSHDVRRTHV